MSGQSGTILQEEPGGLEPGGKEGEPPHIGAQEEEREGRWNHQVGSAADEATTLSTCSRFTGSLCGL